MVILHDAVRKLWLLLAFPLLNTGLLLLERVARVGPSERSEEAQIGLRHNRTQSTWTSRLRRTALWVLLIEKGLTQSGNLTQMWNWQARKGTQRMKRESNKPHYQREKSRSWLMNKVQSPAGLVGPNRSTAFAAPTEYFILDPEASIKGPRAILHLEEGRNL